jgi:arylsulfatase A-like enzyme
VLPTRQALLTGRNHHAVGMGGITEIATSAPGCNSIRPNTAAPLAETLHFLAAEERLKVAMARQ